MLDYSSYFIIFVSGFLGLSFGSFASVLLSRTKNSKDGIIDGRSECPKCGHILGALDLVPVFSYVFLGGKCRFCKVKIPIFYPTLELLTGTIFAFVTYGLIERLSGALPGSEFFIILALQLFISFITIAYSTYDFLYQEVPIRTVGVGILILFAMLLGSSLPGSNPWMFSYFDKLEGFSPIADGLLGSITVYTFFYLQILIPGAKYLSKKRNWNGLFTLLSYYFTYPILMTKETFIGEVNEESEDEEEIPTWMGWGDLWIAIFIGLSLGFKMTMMALVLGYLSGSVIGIILILKNGRSGQMMAFGPFLGIGTIIALVYYQDILNLYLSILGIK